MRAEEAQNSIGDGSLELTVEMVLDFLLQAWRFQLEQKGGKTETPPPISLSATVGILPINKDGVGEVSDATLANLTCREVGFSASVKWDTGQVFCMRIATASNGIKWTQCVIDQVRAGTGGAHS